MCSVILTHSGYVDNLQKTYQGKIAPRNIGRRKDFWNRLDMATTTCKCGRVARMVVAIDALPITTSLNSLIAGDALTIC